MRLKIHLVFLLAIILAGSPYANAMCPERCTCDDVNLIVTCIKAGLEVMPNTLNPRLNTIIYKYNNFPTVDVSLRFLSKLVTVDLSHNGIISVSDRAFARNSDLKSLKLDGNKISQISNKTFYGLTHAQSISLRGNEIAELPSNLFKFAPKVQKLDLARNSISQISSETFHGLPDLKILHLEDNFLTEIPTESLKVLTVLSELHLSGNALKVISNNAFVHFHALTILDLNSCRIGKIQKKAFNGLGQTLRNLKLQDNNLTSIPTEALSRVQNLNSLKIGQNPFISIPEKSLTILGQLKHLDISGCNQLTSVEQNAFQGLKDLKSLKMTLNRALIYIDPEAFESSDALKSLNLASNGLQTLPQNLLNWNELKHLDLSGNPWHCDNCEMAFLPSILQELSAKNSSEKIIAGQCVTPENVRGQSLHDLKIECDFQDSENVEKSPKNDAINRHEASNNLAVIVSVSIVSTVVILTILTLLYLKLKRRIQNWVKEFKWRRHDERLRAKTCQSSMVNSDPLHQVYLKGDNYIYTSPRLHHTYVYHGQSPLHVQQQYYSSQDDDDQYFYVSNHHYNAQDTAVTLDHNGYATTGKHIPVTVL